MKFLRTPSGLLLTLISLTVIHTSPSTLLAMARTQDGASRSQNKGYGSGSTATYDDTVMPSDYDTRLNATDQAAVSGHGGEAPTGAISGAEGPSSGDTTSGDTTFGGPTDGRTISPDVTQDRTGSIGRSTFPATNDRGVASPAPTPNQISR